LNAYAETRLILDALIFSELTAVNPIKNRHAFDWFLFYKLVIRHRVWHQVKHQFAACSVDSTTQNRVDALAKHCQQDKRRILVTAGETVRIARVLKRESIAHCFIKGLLLNVYLYDGLYTRPCRDIDIWVDLIAYTQAMDILLSLGYEKKLPEYDLIGFKKSYYMSNKHDMAFYHPTRRVLVELHFKLSYFGIQFFPFSKIKYQSIDLLHVPVTTLEDHYHLLYLMIHGAIHAWMRLRWLHDIVLFIQKNRCDIDAVYALAKQIHAEHVVEQTLTLVHDLFLLQDEAVNRLVQKASRRSRQLTQMAKQFIFSDYEMIDGIRHPILFFKYRLYIAKMALQGQKFNAICGDLFKIDNLFPYVTFPKALSFMYYLCYPLWILKFIWSSIRAG